MAEQTGFKPKSNLLFIVTGQAITKAIYFPTESEISENRSIVSNNTIGALGIYGAYLVSWPVNPNFTGKSGIMIMCEDFLTAKGLTFADDCQFIERPY